MGWQVYAGCAIAWNAASGGVAAAHDFALGGMAQAAQANNEAATSFIQPILFFRASEVVIRYMEVFDEAKFRMRLHPTPSKHMYQKYKCQNDTLSSSLLLSSTKTGSLLSASI